MVWPTPTGLGLKLRHAMVGTLTSGVTLDGSGIDPASFMFVYVVWAFVICIGTAINEEVIASIKINTRNVVFFIFYSPLYPNWVRISTLIIEYLKCCRMLLRLTEKNNILVTRCKYRLAS